MDSCTNNIRQWLVPTNCLLCETQVDSGSKVCPACLEALPYNYHPTCHRCALPLEDPKNTLCGQCQQHPPAWDFALSTFSYTHPIDKLIQSMKFHDKLDVAYLLGTLMHNFIKSHYLIHKRKLPELLIPVPLHRTRLRERGFNQAIELARPLSQHFAISINKHACQRTVATKPQSDLNMHDRARNLRQAFQADVIPVSHVAIIDDVMTTGHTIEEVSKSLRFAGVKQIDVWVCARAQK